MGAIHRRAIALFCSPAWPVIVGSFLLGGCYSPSSYTGDGTIAETYEQAHKYKISLGEIDLSSEGEWVFELAGLPPEESIVSLNVTRISGDGGPLYEEHPLDAHIELRLVNERGEVVIDESLGLHRWTWTGARDDHLHSSVFRPGASVDVPIGPAEKGTVRVEQVDVRADDGWGTYFEPRRNGVYRLEFTILESDPSASDFQVELAVYSGWRWYLLM